MLAEGLLLKGSTSEWLFSLNFPDSMGNLRAQKAPYLCHRMSAGHGARLHCRNSLSALLRYELTVTRSTHGIQESAWKSLPRNVRSVPCSPPPPRAPKMVTSSGPTVEATLRPLTHQAPSRVLRFTKCVPGEARREALWKASAQAPC